MESAGNFHNFSGDTTYDLIAPNVQSAGTIYNSEGYRVVGGLGTDRISLFKGEIYAGYQQQLYDYTPFGSPSEPGLWLQDFLVSDQSRDHQRDAGRELSGLPASRWPTTRPEARRM